MIRQLYIFRGLPGSGKTTIARQMEVVYSQAGYSTLAVAADDFYPNGEFDSSLLSKVHEQCKKSVEAAMGDETDFIFVHNTNTQAWEMQPYEEMANKYRYRVSHVVVENRHGSVSNSGVPGGTLKKMRNRFELQLVPEENIKAGILGPLDYKELGIKGTILAHKAVPQRLDYHPENDVLTHTAIVCSQLEHNPEMFWAAVFHDLGKWQTTSKHPKRGHYTSYGHTKVSLEIFDWWFETTDRVPPSIHWPTVRWLIEHHMDRDFDYGSHGWGLMLKLFHEADDMPAYFEKYNPTPEILEQMRNQFVDWVLNDWKTPRIQTVGNLVPRGRDEDEIKADMAQAIRNKEANEEV